MDFADLMDNGYIYRGGEAYPRSGVAVTRERLEYLAGNDNLNGFPLIGWMGGGKPEYPEEKAEPKSEPEPKPAKKPAGKAKAKK